ncbi:MAG TPA: hypothetical protein VD995_23565 [Azospirillum sp.]|nr:hypothetical protein [Azospirillum sp.]
MAARSLLPRRIFAAALTFAFLAGLWLPMARQHSVVPAMVLDDASRPRPFADIDKRFEEQFAWRQRLRDAYYRVRWAAFGALVPSVLQGKDGWFFYRSEKVKDGPGIDDVMGQLRVDAATLDRWRTILRARTAELGRRGIRYVAAVAPNKQTIYPDLLPDGVPAHRVGPTRLEQALTHLDPGLPIDLTPALRAARGESQIYFKTDTHWSPTGAFVGYRVLAERLAALLPDVEPIERARLKEVRGPYYGDMSSLASVPLIESAAPRLFGAVEFPARCAGGAALLTVQESTCPPMQIGQPYVTRRDDERLPKAVVFHDSFMDAMAPFLAQHFRAAVFERGAFNPATILREKPDVVIEMRVERYLDHFFIDLPWPAPQS